MRKKVAVLLICLNKPYWPFLKQVIEDAQTHFLKSHDVTFLLWSDVPDSGDPKELFKNDPTDAQIQESLKEHPEESIKLSMTPSQEVLTETFEFIQDNKNIRVFPTEPVQWPYPTLMRYHLFLQQEEVLKEYDHLFYLDVDMRIVDTVSDEIMGEGITMAEHPMYSLRREYIPPYEPNSASTAFIPRFGVTIQDERGIPYFKPLYAAGGFQGGTTESFITAMKEMRKNIDADFVNNYTAIWNDESHWNKYLYGYSGPMVILSPSYVYPDSLIQEYYVKVWGVNYKPIIVTLTKKFTTSREAGEQVKKRLESL